MPALPGDDNVKLRLERAPRIARPTRIATAPVLYRPGAARQDAGAVLFPAPLRRLVFPA